MSTTQFARIQRFQNRVLRCVTSSGRYDATVADLHVMTDTAYFSEYVYDISEKFYRTKIGASALTHNLTQVRAADEVKHKPLYAKLPLYFEDRVP